MRRVENDSKLSLSSRHVSNVGASDEQLKSIVLFPPHFETISWVQRRHSQQDKQEAACLNASSGSLEKYTEDQVCFQIC